MLNKTEKTKIEITEHQPEYVQVGLLEPVLKPELQDIQPDYSLLKTLLDFRTHSKSKEQDVFISYLKYYLEEKGATCDIDAYGNLYAVKGSNHIYPCIVAHTDINQHKVTDAQVCHTDLWIFGIDNETGQQCGIGADDKVGVYFALEMFDRFTNLKLFFPKDEEIGLIGTSNANQDFFSDCSMIVQLDRRSDRNELIKSTNGVTVLSTEFIEAADDIMTAYSYVTGSGTCTDVGAIAQFSTVKCVAMNVSCGYINEHMDDEVISKPHFVNAINFGYNLLLMGVDEVWEHNATPVIVSYNYRYAKDWSLDNYYLDPFDSTESKTSSNGFSKIHIKESDISHSRYMEDMYPEFLDPEKRLELFHDLAEELILDSGFDDQETIDDYLQDGYCPVCYSCVYPTNTLLLFTACDDCGSVFNKVY